MLFRYFLFRKNEDTKDTLNECFFNYLKEKGITTSSRMLSKYDALIIPLADAPCIDQSYIDYYYGRLKALDTYDEKVSLYGDNVIQLKTFLLFTDFLKESQHKQQVQNSIKVLLKNIVRLFIISDEEQREKYIKALQATFNHEFIKTEI